MSARARSAGRLALAAVALGAASAAAQTPTIPEADSAAWLPLERHGAIVTDAAGDGGAAGRDLVGDVASPAIAVTSDGVFLYLRLRVAGKPTDDGGVLGDHGWGCQASVDQDVTTFEGVGVLAPGATGVRTFTHAGGTLPDDGAGGELTAPGAPDPPLAPYPTCLLYTSPSPRD